MRRIREENDASRISKMVASWQKDGRAFSNIQYDDDAFFKAIKVSQDRVGTTSQTGNDLLYYNTSLFGSDSDALRNNKTKNESRISSRIEQRLRRKIRGIVESVLREEGPVTLNTQQQRAIELSLDKVGQAVDHMEMSLKTEVFKKISEIKKLLNMRT